MVGGALGRAAILGDVGGAPPQDWAEISEPAWREVFATAVTKAGVGPGLRHLDIGCGAGGALVVSRGLGAEVAGIDASANLVAIARRRLPGGRIEVGEMEELPFADRSFDVVTGINSFQFSGDPVRALAEARRVLRPGGGMLVLVWGRREDCELITVTMPAVFGLLPPSPTGAAAPRPWAEPGFVEGLMAEAGLDPSQHGEFTAALAFADADAALRAVLSASARAIRHAGEATVADAVRATLPKVSRPDGTVVWRNRFRWVRGLRAGG
jgi:SAM-dependent methyltransferase